MQRYKIFFIFTKLRRIFHIWKICIKTLEKIWVVRKKALNLQSQSPGGGMVDALVSGASAARRAGSSPVLGTI